MHVEVVPKVTINYKRMQRSTAASTECIITCYLKNIAKANLPIRQAMVDALATVRSVLYARPKHI